MNQNSKPTKYNYPPNASQSAKAKIRREARAALKEANAPKTGTDQFNYSVSFVGHDDQNEVVMIPEELAHKLLSIKNITKHFVFNRHDDPETGMAEILSSFNGWSWNAPVEATEPDQEQLKMDEAELDKLLNV